MNRPKLLAARTPADGLQAAHVACTRKVQQEDKAAAVVTITTDCLILTKVTAKTRFCLGMAPSRRLKHLVCFYCNGRSAQKQDGTVRQWDCKGCDATNYLDEVSDFVSSFHKANIFYSAWRDNGPAYLCYRQHHERLLCPGHRATRMVDCVDSGPGLLSNMCQEPTPL